MLSQMGWMFRCEPIPDCGAGQRLDGPLALDGALDAADLDWKVERVPLMTAEDPPSPVADRVALVRGDRGAGQEGRVVGVAHPDFPLLQNRPGAEAFDALLGAGQALYHAGGHLGHGQVVWLLARFQGRIRVRDNDGLDGFLIYTNSHDGSVAHNVRLVILSPVRHTCLTLPLRGGPVKDLLRGLAHEAEARSARAVFRDLVRQRLQEAEAWFHRLAEAPCTLAQLHTFLGETLIPDPPPRGSGDEAAKARHARRTEAARCAREGVQAVFAEGIPRLGIDAAEGSWWGAINSIVAWVDHLQPAEHDRCAHLLLGYGNKLKLAALEHIGKL